ncbi:hypothetical protein L596_028583 [Steinernema carpocapsae]|nr:hypothetical protein L596_028580 [Steinernema carpocapsae]TKR61479.1 hypothetical protein L596_028583 [Steinernema carpocapsae]
MSPKTVFALAFLFVVLATFQVQARPNLNSTAVKHLELFEDMCCRGPFHCNDYCLAKGCYSGGHCLQPAAKFFGHECTIECRCNC